VAFCQPADAVAEKENTSRQPKASGSTSSRASSLRSIPSLRLRGRGGGDATSSGTKGSNEAKASGSDKPVADKTPFQLTELYDIKGISLRINDCSSIAAMDQSVMEVVHQSFRHKQGGGGSSGGTREGHCVLASSGVWHTSHNVTYTLHRRAEPAGGMVSAHGPPMTIKNRNGDSHYPCSLLPRPGGCSCGGL